MVHEDDTPIMWQTRKLIIIVSRIEVIKIKSSLKIESMTLTWALIYVKGFSNEAEQTKWEPAETQTNVERVNFDLIFDLINFALS